MFKFKREIVEAFRDRGLRCTPQRYVVIQYLMRHPVYGAIDVVRGGMHRGTDLRRLRPPPASEPSSRGRHDVGQPDRLSVHPFQYDVTTAENYFPKNVYPKDCKRLEAQVQPLKSYAVELRNGEVWVDLE